MKHTLLRSRTGLICTILMLALFIWTGRSGYACTGIRIKAEDGSIDSARTMEFDVDLKSNIIVVPRGLRYP
jgi:choloylglycine hydrolase